MWGSLRTFVEANHRYTLRCCILLCLMLCLFFLTAQKHWDIQKNRNYTPDCTAELFSDKPHLLDEVSVDERKRSSNEEAAHTTTTKSSPKQARLLNDAVIGKNSLMTDNDRLLTQFEIPTNRSPYCVWEYGSGMIRRWRRSRIDVCTGYGASSIVCFKRDRFDIPRVFCEIENSVIETNTPFYTFKSSDPNLVTGTSFSAGFIQVDCQLTMHAWVPEEFWNDRNMKNFMMPRLIKSGVERIMNCKYNVTHKVLWLGRWDEWNTYHFTEDVEQVFEILLVTQYDPKYMELIIYDGLKRGGLLFAVWSTIFGRGVRILRENPFPEGTCFSRSIISPHAGISLLTNNNGVKQKKKCSSSILKALKQFILNVFDLQNDQKAASIQRRILVIQRKDFHNMRIHRVIPNFHEVVSNLTSKLEIQHPPWKLEVFIPEEFASFREQVETIRSASVLIGVHGAALTYSMYLPQKAHVIEIFYGDRQTGNNHFYNLCQWLDIAYLTTGYLGKEGSYIDADIIWEQVDKAVSVIEMHGNL